MAVLKCYCYRMINPNEMKDWLISKPLNNKLNKLKKSNTEAFFYWYKIYELKSKLNKELIL